MFVKLWIKTFLKRIYLKKKIKLVTIGNHVSLPFDIQVSGAKNCEIQDNVHIGTGAVFMATNAKITIKHNVVASHNLKIITGDHERRIGTFCNTITESTKNHSLNLDQPVVIESDVWIGINVVILKGVTIGRGATVSAGAVVNKSIPPYCICGGVPAKFIKFYWTIDQILEHEEKVYSFEERFTREQLNTIFSLYAKD